MRCISIVLNLGLAHGTSLNINIAHCTNHLIISLLQCWACHGTLYVAVPLALNYLFNFAIWPDNAWPEVGIKQRWVLQIIGLCNFNNWIKSVLITQFAHPALASSTTMNGGGSHGGRGGLHSKVLKLGCGKGGNLNKWSKAQIKEYGGDYTCTCGLHTH